MSLHRPALATAAALALMLGLTGCFSNPLDQLVENGIEQLAEEGFENIIEEQTGIDVDVAGGGQATIPDDFPSVVPVIPGDIGLTQSIADTWLISLYVDSLEEAEAGSQLILDNGFTEIVAVDLSTSGRSHSFENDDYLVIYTYGLDSDTGRVVVTYTVGLNE